MSTGQANPNYSLLNSAKSNSVLMPDSGGADEGSFFTSVLAATASTAVANTTQATGALNPAIALFNGNLPGGYNMYLRYLKIFVTVVGGSNTHKSYVSQVDNLPVKLTTVGTALGAPKNVNTSSPTQSGMQGWGGVNVAAAQTAAGKQLGIGVVTGAVEVAFDEWIFDFGPASYSKNLIGTTTLVSARTVPMCPVILAPGWWWTLGLWGASQAASADTYTIELGWTERPSGQ